MLLDELITKHRPFFIFLFVLWHRDSGLEQRGQDSRPEIPATYVRYNPAE